MLRLSKNWLFRRQIIVKLQSGKSLSDEEFNDPRTVNAQRRFALKEKRRAAKYFKRGVAALWPVAERESSGSGDKYVVNVNYYLYSVELSKASAVLNSINEAKCALSIVEKRIKCETTVTPWRQESYNFGEDVYKSYDMSEVVALLNNPAELCRLVDAELHR